MARRVSKPTQVQRAIQVLVASGASRFRDPQSIGLGRILGAALGPYLQREQILDLAGEALEDGNYHDDAEIVRAMMRPVRNRRARRSFTRY